MVGTGLISGATGLNLNGANTVAILNSGGNNFTGQVVLNAGVLTVTNLADGGSPSAIGASSASPTNLVLAGGTLTYSGPTVTINRGYSLHAHTNSAIMTHEQSDLERLGHRRRWRWINQVGCGAIDLRSTGSNLLSGCRVTCAEDGTVVLDGSNGGQTNWFRGTHLAADGITELATAIMTNTTINTSVNL